MGIFTGIANDGGGSSGGGGASFSPSDISNNILWLDFSDAANTTYDGSKFTAAADLSGEGNDASHATLGPTRSTLNSRNCAVFNGSSNYLDLVDDIVTGSQAPLTVFAAGTIQGSGNRTLLCFGDSSTRCDLMFPNSSTVLQFFPETAGSETIMAGTTGVWGMVYGDIGSGQAIRYIHDGELGLGPGSAAGTINGSNPVPGRLGAFAGSVANRWQGSLGEIIVYRRVLTAKEIGQVNDYLTARWVP